MNNQEVINNQGFENQDSNSFSLFYREESFDYLDDEEDKKPKPNPFNDDLSSFVVMDPGDSWVSKEEVADFMQQSRRLALNEDDDETNLGPAWGGSQYSLSSGITGSSWCSLRGRRLEGTERGKMSV